MDPATYENQFNQTFEAFQERPKTMLMVEVETGIMRSNICRYVAHLKRRNKIVEVRKGRCPISKHKAGFYSTDPELIQAPGQVELFRTDKPLV